MQALRLAAAVRGRWQVLQLTSEACRCAGCGRPGGGAGVLSRGFASDGANDAAVPFGTRLWNHMRGGLQSTSAADSSTTAKSVENRLVSNSPESRFREVLAVALPRRPLFPGGLMPVSVQNDKLIQELIQLKKGGAQAYVGAFLRREPEPAAESEADNGLAAVSAMMDAAEEAPQEKSEEGDSDAADYLHRIGTFAQVHTIAPTEGGAQLLLLGHRRLLRTATTADDPLKVAVQHLKDETYNANDDVLKATTMELVSTLKELLHLHPLYNEQLKSFAAFGGDFHDASRLVDMGASITSASDAQLQAIIEQLSIPERASAVLELLKKEVELCRLQADIGKQVEEKISKDQRRYFLQEQLRSIKKELGLEKDDKSALIQKFQERLQQYGVGIPEEAQRVIDEELAKLGSLEPASSEFNVTRNYLDWLSSVPWGVTSTERLDIAHAQTVLDEDHYGLADVKDRILEFIAVGRLRGSTQGKILCLVGPPGVGKTSIGKSVARALERKYYRFSVGGLSDVAEIKGHRRTYVGAMPGKVVQCLKTTGTSNPLVLIDEIDKLGRGYQGDPASALLELLDPEQNSGFVDHYLDVPVDLSRVLFMCTANTLDSIPQPLLDRMEVIRLSGYIAVEKVNIARRYLEPQAREDAGVPNKATSVTDAAMLELITEYAREAGVRSLKKLLEKIYRKSALALVRREGASPPSDQAAAGTAVSSAGGPVAAPDSPAPPADGSAAAAQPPSEGSEASDGAAAPGDGADSEPAAAESSNDISDDGQLPDNSPQVNPAEGSVVSSPDAQPGATADASDIDGGSSMSSEAIPEWSGDPIVVDTKDLTEYVGQPPFTSDRIYERTPAGVVMGLAWTSLGGNALYIEAAVVEKGEGKGGLRTTGQLGDVMKESASIAHTFTRSFLARRAPQLAADYFGQHSIHMHVPAGATPKDGPSAGCAIITAITSLALDRPVRPDLAMTGEVTLTGRVLPIGGVKEKALAARRSGVSTLIFPSGNRKDWDELTAEVKEGLDVHFADTYEDVYRVAFEYGDAEAAEKVVPHSEQRLAESAAAA